MSDNQFDFGPAAKQIESLKGAANGLASLDSNGLVPSSQLPGATQSVAGLMSAADKTKLDGIATGATANVVSDSLSDTSTTNALSAAKGKALNDSVTALDTQIAQENIKSSLTLGANVSANSQIFKQGKFIYVALSLTSLTNGDILVSNLGNYKPVYTGIGSVFKSSDGSTVSGSIWAESSTGKITYYGSNANFNCASQFVYMCN